MREKFEILAKVSGWNESLTRNSSNDFSADPESLCKLIEHVVAVLERREISCVELNRSLERQQLELEASREQVGLASQRLKEMREKFNESENRVIEANSRQSSMAAQIATLQANFKREKEQAAWSSGELERVLDAFATFRKEQSVLVAETRAKAEAATSQTQELQQRLQITAQSLKEREKQVSELQEQVAHLKSQLSVNEANFTREMNSSTRLVELYKNASEEASERISLLQSEIEEMRELLATAEAQESGHSADLEAELEEREGIIRVKEEQLERMRTALDGLLKSAKSGNNDTADHENSNGDISVYEGKLARAEEECSHLRISMQQMLNELNSRAPLIESLQLDNARLQGDVAALTDQLIQVASSRDATVEDRKDLEKRMAALKTERDTLQQECDDLSQQVQRLLAEIESANSASTAKRQRRDTGDHLLRASEIITENLVDLTSVAQLQQRNQELLRSLRGITAKYEALEREKESPQLKAQLEAALKDLDEMNEARRRQAQMVETILRTKTSNNNESSDAAKSAVVSETLTIELEQLRKQVESKQDLVKKMFTELETLKKELTEEKVAKARLSAQLELNEERFKMLNETLQHERREAASVRERISNQVESFNQAQTSSFKLMADLSGAQERETRLHSQIERLQGEINGLLVETSRLQQEALSVSGERDRLTGLLSSMQGVLNEHEASESTLKRHFTTQVEFMERELEASRARISEITASHSSALNALERDRSELFRRLESLSEELSEKKEKNLRLEGNLAQAQEKILDLERVLQQAAAESTHDENNVKTFELRIRALSTDLKNQQAALLQANERISELEGQLTEMNEVKAQLTAEKENSAALDTNLKESQAEMEHLKDDKERLEEELTGLKDQLTGNQEQILRLSKEIEELRAEISTRTSEKALLEEEKRAALTQLQEAKAQCLKLSDSLTAGESEQRHLKAVIEDIEGRLKTLQQQNDALLDEAQRNFANSNVTDDIDNSDNSGVIRFLRDEKDKLQVEKERLLGEVRSFQVQAEEAQRILNSERLAVSAQASDYARLLAEVERLNSLRESGAQQQHELMQMKLKMTMLESQLKEKTGALAPLRESLDAAQSEIEQLKESMGLLQSDRDSWKSRFETAISTASATTSPLETELKQVKMQSEMFRQRAIALTKNLAEMRAEAQKEIAGLQEEVAKLRGQLESAKVDADVEMGHTESVEAEAEPVALESVIVESMLAPSVESVNAPSVEPVFATAADVDHEAEESAGEVEESGVEEEIEQSEHEEVVSEHVVEASPIVPVEPIIPESPVIESPAIAVTESPVVETPVVAEVPRKKIVSLAGIVGSSASNTTNNAGSMSTTSSNGPAMITTASGKKFVPVTFPDPVATTPTVASTSHPGSPSKGGKAGKKMKKKNKKSME